MKKILLVEDDLTLSKMLATWLGKQGYAVAVVSTVRQARKALEEDDVDLVLSDLRLPDADGTGLLDWMKREQHLCPLIIMTGYADIHSAVTAMKLGAKDFISKLLIVDPEKRYTAKQVSFTLNRAILVGIDASLDAV